MTGPDRNAPEALRPAPALPLRARWWTIAGLTLGAGAFGWILLRLDLPRLQATLVGVRLEYVAILMLGIALEQWVRAWKWRQLLLTLRAVDTLRLYGAIMAGYLVNYIVPLGLSPFVRAWLIARQAALAMSAVLATVLIDRLVDGIVFTVFVAIALAYSVLPETADGVRLAIGIAGFASLALFASGLYLLTRYRDRLRQPGNILLRWIEFLPLRWRPRLLAALRGFADGIAWPRSAWRRLGVVLASVLIKLIALGHFLWAGLAFDVILAPVAYVFVLVFLGFVIIISRFARVPGGFTLGTVFALGLLGVANEAALAMAVSVQLASTVCVATIGAFALWRSGVSLGELRSQAAGAGRRGP